MSSPPQAPALKISRLLVLTVLVLFALHQDFWLRDSSALIAGLPAGLFYHVLYCLAVSVVLGLLLSYLGPGQQPDKRS